MPCYFLGGAVWAFRASGSGRWGVGALGAPGRGSGFGILAASGETVVAYRWVSWVRLSKTRGQSANGNRGWRGASGGLPGWLSAGAGPCAPFATVSSCAAVVKERSRRMRSAETRSSRGNSSSNGNLRSQILPSFLAMRASTIGRWPSVRGASVRFGFGVATRQRARPRAACIPRVFPGEDEATGAQAVGEGVEAHGGLALRSVGTGRVLGILPVGLDSMIGRACGEMG